LDVVLPPQRRAADLNANTLRTQRTGSTTRIGSGLGAPRRHVSNTLSAAALSSFVRFADARGRVKRSDDPGVARDADLLALVPVSLF
jgi:hypothetical protein